MQVRIFAAVIALLLPTVVNGQCKGLTVQCSKVVPINASPAYISASPSLRIVVLLDGKPLKNAFVQLSAASPRLSLVTDERGAVAFSEVPPGPYAVVAKAPRGLRGLLLIKVSPNVAAQPTSLSMYIERCGWTERDLMSAKNGPITLIRTLIGLVQDPSGAGISGATVDIWPYEENDEIGS